MIFDKKIKTNSGRQHGCYGAMCPAVFIFSTGQYGEGQTDDKLYNLRGKPCKVYDGAGLTAIRDYDFKGNTLAQIRTYTEDATAHPDWTTIGSVDMEAETYETATAHDALNRPVTLVTPDGGKTNYTYDKGGLLYSVEVEGVHDLDTEIVNTITYDAKGQREKIQYENGATTTYEYDAFTFRVRRIRTTRTSDSKVLQDLQYWYDPVGNITLQKDGALQAVYFDGTVAVPDNDYTYDALYRLIQAEGREHAGNNQAPDRNDRTRRGISPIPVAATDTAKMRRYMEHYEYDAVGNFIEMRHTVTGGTGNWTRYYTTDENSNKMLESVIGSGTPESYDYDTRGNIIGGFSHLQSLAYNAENRLEKVEINANRTAYYQYDASGQRVRKTIVDTSSSTTETRKYIGEWEVYGKTVSSTLTLERETLHINDDTGRIALTDTRTTGSGTEPAQLLRYQYSNHLSTATLELDDAAAIISYEEYYPYGSTSFQCGRSGAEVSLKRYRYCAAERDEENGFYYFGARYYVPWLARWVSCDPLESKYAGLSPYNYSFNNPVVWNDLSGMGPGDDLPPALPTNDNAKDVTQVIDNQFPYLTPTGGHIFLPPTAEVTGTFDESPLLSDGIMLGQAIPGSVWTFSYQGESYLAQFEDSGQFIGYYSATNSSHFVNGELNTLPQLPESSVRTAMRHIEGGGKFLLGALGAVGSAAFAGASSPTGIGPLVGGAGVVYFSDVAASGFSQMVSGTSTPTYYQQSLSATGMSPGTVATVDFITGAALGMGVSSITSAPVYEFSNAAKGGTQLFGKEVVTTTTRMGRDGKAVEVIFKDGTKIDINAARVKQWTPNTHPNAPAGTLQKVKFENSLPGSKGYKRTPTQSELDFLNGL
jgi:RHS repeat-associated protein